MRPKILYKNRKIVVRGYGFLGAGYSFHIGGFPVKEGGITYNSAKYTINIDSSKPVEDHYIQLQLPDQIPPGAYDLYAEMPEYQTGVIIKSMGIVVLIVE